MNEQDLDFELSKNFEGAWENSEIEVLEPRRSKEDYIDDIQVGVLIAFKIDNCKMLSGKVSEIFEYGYLINTKNGMNFNITRKNIVWVKTGERWPRGIFLALKGEAQNGECKNTNKE